MRATITLLQRTLAYASGGGTGLLGVTVGDALRNAARQWGSSDALIVKNERTRLCYSELLDLAEKLASGLVALGLPKHARVGIYGPNSSEWVVVQFAASLADLILVNINPAYQLTELKHALEKVNVSALIMAAGFKSSNYIDLVSQIVPEIHSNNNSTLISSKSLPYLNHCVLIGPTTQKGFMNLDDLYKLGSSKSEEYKIRTENVSFEDPTNIQFTSGTTGAPKAATLTHHNIVNNGHHCGETLAYTPDDRVCIPVPLYHCFGMVLGNLACITHGSCIVLPGASFDPVETMDTVESEKITSLYGVPTMFIANLKEQERKKRQVNTLRTGIVAGAICPAPLMKGIIDQLGITEMTNAYGMTETSPLSFHLPRHSTIEQRTNSVGLVAPHVEAKIVNPATGAIIRRGETGELLTKGYIVMKGYWGDDIATKKAINTDGWMHTGDLAVMTDDGYVSIVGRCKDVIIRGGENISPSEIEHYLLTYPGIEEVHVFGVPDDVYGEAVVAWLRLRDSCDERGLTVEDIRNFCRGNIAHFKIPSVVKIVKEFPLTVTGKVMKFKMREMHLKDFING